MRKGWAVAMIAALALAGCGSSGSSDTGADSDEPPLATVTAGTDADDPPPWQNAGMEADSNVEGINEMIAESANESVMLDQATAFTNMSESLDPAVSDTARPDAVAGGSSDQGSGDGGR